MTTTILPVILAGGSGTRLWPLSRKNYPKQFLQLQGEYSLLQQTVRRAQLLSPEQIHIVSNETHYFLCQEQLQSYTTPIHYLLEPCARNTAPAIASVAHHLIEEKGSDALMLILPSDHWIEDESAWCDAMCRGIQYAEKHDAIVTFGIKPDAPKTGYGYIEARDIKNKHVLAVNRFCEKPSKEHAESFLAAGHYFWNSGMFVCRAETYLNELKRYAPDIHQQSKHALNEARHLNDYLRLDTDAFTKCRSESIDYAIMEKTTKAYVIPVDMKWSDLGCWGAVAEAQETNDEGNTLQGNIIAQQTSGCFISSEETLVTTLGIKDQIIIATHDAILVADKQYTQQVKDIVNSLGKQNISTITEHAKVKRPWGYYQILAEGKTFKVKRLMVKPGAKLSLQMHQHRAEHWVVVAGIAEVINDTESMQLQVNESTYIPLKTRHRLSNPGAEPLFVIEIQSGSYLGEDDITRFNDVYSHCRVT